MSKPFGFLFDIINANCFFQRGSVIQNGRSRGSYFKSSFQKTEKLNNCNQKTNTNQNKGVSIVTESIELKQNENVNSNSKTNKSGKKENKRKRTVKRNVKQNEPAERGNDNPLNAQPDKQGKAGI